MPKLIITVGISASGKSTYAKELVKQGWVEVNRDFWRFNLFCEGVQDWSLYKSSKQKEDEVSKYCLDQWDLAIDPQFRDDVIISNTNLNPKDLDCWKTKGEEAGYEVEIKYFDILLEEALKRDSKRGGLQVGRETILKQWKKWLDITNFKRYEPNEFKPKAMWVDLDGTLAINTHRGHHDYNKVITDTPRLDVMSMICALMDRDDITPVFMSGRPESCREDTVKWLLNYFNEVPYLYMRTTGDTRSDRIVKQELFWEFLDPHWNIVVAIDDRPKINRLQKDLGISLVVSVQRDYLEF